MGNFDLLNGAAPVSLDLTGVKGEPYVYGAEVLRQVWKWQGRPVKTLPLTAGSDRDNWLANEFGNRTDFLRSAMTHSRARFGKPKVHLHRGSRLPSQYGGSRGHQQSNGLPRPPLFPADVGLLGTYIRYGAQVFTRYQPVCAGSAVTRPVRARVAPSGKICYIPSRKTTRRSSPLT